MSLISIENVHKYYGDYHALRDINMEVGQGEFFSLLGPSGCGKTTLLRTIAGFEDVSSGQVRIGGASMVGVPANQRPTNMVFQSYAIFPHMSVAENVGFGLRKSGLSGAEKVTAVGEALEMVGLNGFGARSAHALSGGQRQRVALARALILKPKVLLLDEPLSALDKKMREQMQSELRRLQRQVGITFILVTHDQEEALIMSDRIAVMFDGKIAQLDPPQQLYTRPTNRQVAEFIGVMTFLPGTCRQGELEVAGLGRVTLGDDQIIGADGDVRVGLRPESMTILFDHTGTDPAGRVAQGTVADLAYYGDMTMYEIRLNGAPRPVTVSMRNLPGRPVLARGDAASVAWDPAALMAFGETPSIV